jgi:Cellulase family 8 (EC 3.2.1.4)
VMKSVRWIVLLLALGTMVQAQAACNWPAWDQFKKDYVSAEGRVIDPSDARKITTSEGQSYALFFALAANDRETFGNCSTGRRTTWRRVT